MSLLGDLPLALIAITGVLAFLLTKYLREFYSKWMEPDVIDPATGLSSREKCLVRESWGLARQDLKAAGTGLFFALFKAHSEYQKLFKAFGDVPVDQLMKSGPFIAHAMNVVNAVSLIVDSLDDAPTLVVLLKRVGKSHGRRNITEDHFLNLNAVIVNFLEEALGKKNFSEDCCKSWAHVLEVATSVLKTDL